MYKMNFNCTFVSEKLKRHFIVNFRNMGCTALQHRHRTSVFGNSLRSGPKCSSKSGAKCRETDVPELRLRILQVKP